MSTRWAGLVRQAGNGYLPNSLYDSSFLPSSSEDSWGWWQVFSSSLTAPGGVLENKVIFWILDKITSIFRAVPFIILLAIMSPLSHLIVKTSIGPNAALVPLLLRSLPFFARQVQVVLAELDGGVIEAAQTSGATFWDIVGVYLSEGLPDLIRVTTVTLISLVGETAMAGAVGAGGIGNVAIAYGFNRYNHDDHLGDHYYHLDYLYNPVLGRFLDQETKS